MAKELISLVWFIKGLYIIHIVFGATESQPIFITDFRHNVTDGQSLTKRIDVESSKIYNVQANIFPQRGTLQGSLVLSKYRDEFEMKNYKLTKKTTNHSEVMKIAEDIRMEPGEYIVIKYKGNGTLQLKRNLSHMMLNDLGNDNVPTQTQFTTETAISGEPTRNFRSIILFRLFMVLIWNIFFFE